MLQFLAAVLITIAAAGDNVPSGVPSNDISGGGNDATPVAIAEVDDGFKRNSVNVASCEDSNAIGSSGSYW